GLARAIAQATRAVEQRAAFAADPPTAVGNPRALGRPPQHKYEAARVVIEKRGRWLTRRQVDPAPSELGAQHVLGLILARNFGMHLAADILALHGIAGSPPVAVPREYVDAVLPDERGVWHLVDPGFADGIGCHEGIVATVLPL